MTDNHPGSPWLLRGSRLRCRPGGRRVRPGVEAPPAILTGVALVVILGFPVALVIAWAFEVTPEGVKRTEDARPGELEAIVAERASNRWPIGLAALVGVALIGLSAW